MSGIGLCVLIKHVYWTILCLIQGSGDITGDIHAKEENLKKFEIVLVTEKENLHNLVRLTNTRDTQKEL